MEKITNELVELKSMQKHPKLYLANYFSDLKQEVDLFYVLKLDEKDKYKEIINQIETFEQYLYNKIKQLFNNEIELIEKNIESISLAGETLDELRYNIEKLIFSSKSIFKNIIYQLLLRLFLDCIDFLKIRFVPLTTGVVLAIFRNLFSPSLNAYFVFYQIASKMIPDRI